MTYADCSSDLIFALFSNSRAPSAWTCPYNTEFASDVTGQLARCARPQDRETFMVLEHALERSQSCHSSCDDMRAYARSKGWDETYKWIEKTIEQVDEQREKAVRYKEQLVKENQQLDEEKKKVIKENEKLVQENNKLIGWNTYLTKDWITNSSKTCSSNLGRFMVFCKGQFFR
ncbi:uncharacterized protein MYCGRDRAFT_97627 [Zymoseptoria tritici IPO323]|uniref:Uncharacterized protein n=1 Tax=Zymoseptoria tritici (strain CBS 115943 / IPO323) TaxID=336722 RepID=F9XR24_ZYMTI|nr:uncharacterized protein MYCGRDRAFT_97627 [Zymoseptoria tritici IPO323]EGP82363.1 hypothetical protein MYCGRDRAFT_97627 [Zymoseptoria tritici IPO323]